MAYRTKRNCQSTTPPQSVTMSLIGEMRPVPENPASATRARDAYPPERADHAEVGPSAAMWNPTQLPAWPTRGLALPSIIRQLQPSG